MKMNEYIRNTIFTCFWNVFVNLQSTYGEYAKDELIRENGHEVLRLPPYYPDFNAIELIWSQLKAIVCQKKISLLGLLLSFFCILFLS